VSDDTIEEERPLRVLIIAEGPVPDTKEAERAARSTTNRDEPRD
jgi:hypothetical protein